MSENYIVINGKRAELTKEQMEALGIEEKFESPYADPSEKYVRTITLYGTDIVLNTSYLITSGLAFKQKEEAFARQVRLHELLYRKLLKYAYDTNTIDRSEWDGRNYHYFVVKDSKHYRVRAQLAEKFLNTVYFNSADAIFKVIENVILPFEKEHPEFIW